MEMTTKKRFCDMTEREQNRVLKCEIVSQVKKMLGMCEGDGRVWAGSVTDLLELLKVGYVSGELQRADGMTMSFTEIVSQVFGVMRLKPLSNPYARVQRAERRKGVRCLTIQDRLRNVLLRAEADYDTELFWRTCYVGA